MNAQLAQLNAYVKSLSGVKLFYFISFCFVLCLVIGLGVGYLFVLASGPAEPITVGNVQIPVTETFYQGRIDYVEPRLYPGMDVSYVLVNSKGDVLYLLKADDSILQVAEGHTAKVYGNIEKKVSGAKYDTLKVTKVVIKSSEK